MVDFGELSLQRGLALVEADKLKQRLMGLPGVLYRLGFTSARVRQGLNILLKPLVALLFAVELRAMALLCIERLALRLHLVEPTMSIGT